MTSIAAGRRLIGLAGIDRIPLEAPPARTFYFPSSTVVLTLSAEHWPPDRRRLLDGTPRLADGPWVIDYNLEARKNCFSTLC